MTKYRIVFMPRYDVYSLQKGVWIFWTELWRWSTFEGAKRHADSIEKDKRLARLSDEVVWEN